MLKPDFMLKPESIRTCVLYDPSDGRIVHCHEIVHFETGIEIDDKDMESKTLRLATNLEHETSKLQALHLSGPFPSDKRYYKVDPQSRRLVAIPRPS